MAASMFAPAAVASEDDPGAPVSLSAATDDLERVKDSRGKGLTVVSQKGGKSDEKTVVAMTADEQVVLLRSLYAPKPKTPTNDAVEPGLDGWVAGETYFTDGKPITSEEVIHFDDLPRIDPATLELAFSTATSETSFSAAWTGNDDLAYDVLRNGKRIATVTDGTFTDSAAGDKYGGDSRSYFFPQLYLDPWGSASHRTGARMKIDFGPNAVIEQKDVGETRLYTSSGALKAKRTASTDGIVFSERSVSSSLYRVKLSHSVGNPFCNKGAIRYTVYLNTWSSGVMQVNGYRHPVPAHEAYGLFMNSSGSEYWTTMYRGAQGDFFCISGTCPTQTISKTHTPA